MSAKTERKVKHIPQRTCVGCRTVLPKRTLVRLVRTPSGVMIDPSGKLAGRGAYLHNRRSCWERGLKGALGNAFMTNLTDEDRERLRAFMVSLPDDPDEDLAPAPLTGQAGGEASGGEDPSEGLE